MKQARNQANKELRSVPRSFIEKTNGRVCKAAAAPVTGVHRVGRAGELPRVPIRPVLTKEVFNANIKEIRAKHADGPARPTASDPMLDHLRVLRKST
jgi:hypothetical protein